MSKIVDDSTDRYLLNNVIGRGAFSKVYRCSSVNTTIDFAIKVVEKTSLIRYLAKEKLENEIRIHKRLDHANIVKFFGYFEDKHNVYLLLELCEGFSLEKHIKHDGSLSDSEAGYFGYQIISGVGYLHNLNILHHDLKPANIFLTKDMVVKLGDFGLSCYKEDGGRHHMGTPKYMAPEMVGCFRFKSKKEISFPIDIWAFGCIVYIMKFNKTPFETSSTDATYKNIQKCRYQCPSNASKQVKSIIRMCLQENQANRPLPQQLLKHDFLKKAPKSYQSKRRIPMLTTKIHNNNNNNDLLYKIITTYENEMHDMQTSETPIIYITKWVDYTNRYGFGYELSNGSVGVLFKDHSTMLCDADENITCVPETSQNYDFKRKLLSYFKGYMIDNLEDMPYNSTDNDVYLLKTYGMETRMFFLSHGVVQFNFKDHTKIILDPKQNIFMKIENGERQTLSLKNIRTLKGCYLDKIKYMLR